jgi:predicted transcriptional regulator
MPKLETLARDRLKKRPQRTKDQILKEILLLVKERNNELKRTNIAGKVEINYITSVIYTDEMVENGMIKRDNKGYYSITQKGKETIVKYAINQDDLTEIVKIAREMAMRSPLDHTGNCDYCGNFATASKNHAGDCEWARLREIFGMNETE